jgi:ankyrin repeat protein
MNIFCLSPLVCQIFQPHCCKPLWNPRCQLGDYRVSSQKRNNNKKGQEQETEKQKAKTLSFLRAKKKKKNWRKMEQHQQISPFPLHQAIAEGDLKLVGQLLKAKDGIDINQRDLHGLTPLSLAAHLGHFEIIKLLLSKVAQTTQLTIVPCLCSRLTLLRLFFFSLFFFCSFFFLCDNH